MTNYCPPTKDFLFLLYELFEIQNLEINGLSEYTKETVEPILNEAGRLAVEIIVPTNSIGDRDGCNLNSGVVETPPEFKKAFKMMCDGEWPSLNCDPKYGGQGVPLTVSTAVGEIFASANVALFIYHALSHGVYSTIRAHGTDEQKTKYLPNLVTSKWTGTMNLTEPQCGTDLGLVTTQARLVDDGSYKISGQKIYISAGDHDLADNIIHLVLARIKGGPKGVKGISLFIVPKLLTDPTEKITVHNKVSVGKIENKMGIHGNATCVMNYDGATGYLLGSENKGLRAMFTMMNEARLAVGVQGLSQAEIAYQNAAWYAKDRTQGKSVSTPVQSESTADPIISHPDVRRMLMEQKSFIEGARAFSIWSSLLIDKKNILNDLEADGLVSLLIPIFKAFLSDKGFESTVTAQQIFGGNGYVEDSGMSQFVRDSRIAMIYEGTNGIQAIDLVGRKLLVDGGKHVIKLINEINTFIIENSQNSRLNESFLEPLKSSLADLQTSLTYFMERGLSDPDNVLSGATDFLHLFGHVILGYMWSKMARKSLLCLEKNLVDKDFYNSKLITGSFYMGRCLPETQLRLTRILSDKNLVMDLEPNLF